MLASQSLDRPCGVVTLAFMVAAQHSEQLGESLAIGFREGGHRLYLRSSSPHHAPRSKTIFGDRRRRTPGDPGG
jgi:DNA-binding IclR family transcriptional regulator